jgi:hypothetical protein
MAMSDLLFNDLLSDLDQFLPSGFREKPVQWGPDLDPKKVAAICLAKSFLKKFSSSDRTSPDGDAVAFEKFQRSNERCRAWVFAPETSLDEELMGEFKNLLYRFLHPSGDPLVFHINDLFDRGRVGPGASIGARGEDFYTKMFSSPLTCCSEVVSRAYYHALTGDQLQTWWLAESKRQSLFDEVTHVKGSRFSFVPKDDTTSRLIAIEPSLSMFYQLGLGRLLEERLVSFFGLDITSQPQINQEAARFGSVTDELATLDLSDASDSMGLPMLKWALPRGFYDLLLALRSPYGEHNSEWLELSMVSTMGNGFTFPLETLLFSCVVVASIKSMRTDPIRPYMSSLDPEVTDKAPLGYWGVFGDDIICHKRVAHRVTRLLGLLGFKVNGDKSFVEGYFRESCGRDYFRGHDVRGVYIKRLSTPESRYVAINNLNTWSAKVGIYLPKTVRRLVESVKWTPVPPSENHDAGIRVPSWMVDLRFNKNGTVVYNRRLPNPKKLTILDGYISIPSKVKRRFYNPEGLLLAFLHGSVRNGRITLRQSEVRYHTKRGVVPYWDYLPPTSDILSSCSRQRWEGAVGVNLGTRLG